MALKLNIMCVFNHIDLQASDIIAFFAFLISVFSLLWQLYSVIFKNKIYISMLSVGLNNTGLSGPHQFYMYITTNSDVPFLIGSVSSDYFSKSLSEVYQLTNKTPLFMLIDSNSLHEAMGLSKSVSIKVSCVFYNRGIKVKNKRVKIQGFVP